MENMDLEQKHMQNGKKQLNAGHPHNALNDFHAALKINPQNARAHTYMALAFYELKLFKKAQEEVQIGLGLAPESAFGHSVMGMIFLAINKYSAAEQSLKKALALNSNDGLGYVLLSRVYQRTNKKLVLPTLEDGLYQSPQNVNILVDMSAYYLRTQDLRAAKKFALDALRINPEHKDANVTNGVIALRNGDITEAKNNALMALKDNARYAPALHLMCQIRLKTSLFWRPFWYYSIALRRYGKIKIILFFLAIMFSPPFILGHFFNFSDNIIEDVIPNVCLWTVILFTLYVRLGSNYFKRSLAKELREVQLSKTF